MSWVAAATVGAAVIGGAVQSDSASKASYSQRLASDQASALQQQQYDQTRADNAPYRALASEVAIPGIRDFLAKNNSQLSTGDVTSEPGYQFGLSEGTKALQGSAAAKGGLYSGATLKALLRFGNDYGSTKYNDAFNRLETSRSNQYNRLASAAGIGQAATGQVTAAGQNYASNVGSNLIGAGNAAGASSIAQGNAFGNALNRLTSYGNNWNYGSNPNNKGAGSNFWNGFSDQDVYEN